MMTTTLRLARTSLAVLALLSTSTALNAMTVEIAGGGTRFVEPGDTWRFFRGRSAPSAPASAWKEIDFDDAAWETGPGGFGYGYTAGIGTTLADMEDNYFSVYIRREFTVAAPLDDAAVELEIDHDDGFVAYLNGQLAAWRNMSQDPGTTAILFNTPATSHGAGTPATIALGSASAVLREGKNVLAIEGHNVNLGSSDLALIPALRSRSSIVEDGAAWVVETAAQSLRGTTSSPQAVAVRVGGAAAAFNAADRSWQASITLSPGRNRVAVEALDAGGAVVDAGAIDVVYVPPSQQFAGTLAGDTTWSSAAAAVIVDGTLVVPAGATLRVEPGVVVYLKPAAGIRVLGRLLAEGSEAEPIRWTRYGDGAPWSRLLFSRAGESRFSHCIFEHADSEGAHQDYYEAGPRSYHEAIVALATRLEFESCLFHKLPDDSAGAEGDAIAVISDDPEVPGEAAAVVRNCRFIAIGQGVHTRFSHVLVENCFFTGKRGDNDDVDLWGESTPPPLIRHNTFIDPEHDDAINPTRCSAIIVGNFIAGSDDHGIVCRDRGSPVLINNVISRCASGGIAVENSSSALLINNTVVDCGRGLRLFDLGRWDAPYFLNPGGGTATVINCVIRDCPQPITLADSDNTTIADRGSHVTVLYSNVEGGRGAVSVSGAQSTVTWGDGNIDADPRFADAGAGDFRVAEDSPVVNAGTDAHEQVPDTDFDGKPRPCAGGIDMGAYEAGDCGAAPQTRFRRGDANADGGVDVSDAVFILLRLFAGGAPPDCEKSADADAGGSIALNDAVYLLNFLFRDGEAPASPFPSCGVEPSVEPEALTCEAFAACS
jgi:parallel beta-helix repeat protein